MLRHFIRDAQGATAVEYGLIAALLTLAVVGAYQAVGVAVRDSLFDNVAEQMP